MSATGCTLDPGEPAVTRASLARRYMVGRRLNNLADAQRPRSLAVAAAS